MYINQPHLYLSLAAGIISVGAVNAQEPLSLKTSSTFDTVAVQDLSVRTPVPDQSDVGTPPVSTDDAEEVIRGMMLDPLFEDTFVDAVRARIARARDEDDRSFKESDLSIEALRSDPIFDAALREQVEDAADALIFDQSDREPSFDLSREPLMSDGLVRGGDHWIGVDVGPIAVPPIAQCKVRRFTWPGDSGSIGAVGGTVNQALKSADTAANKEGMKKRPAQLAWVKAQSCPVNCTKVPIAPLPSTLSVQTRWDVARDALSAANPFTPPTFHATGYWTIDANVFCR